MAVVAEVSMAGAAAVMAADDTLGISAGMVTKLVIQ